MQTINMPTGRFRIVPNVHSIFNLDQGLRVEKEFYLAEDTGHGLGTEIPSDTTPRVWRPAARADIGLLGDLLGGEAGFKPFEVGLIDYKPLEELSAKVDAAEAKLDANWRRTLDLLWLFRDYVIKQGKNLTHHHPIWAAVGEALEGYPDQINTGPIYRFTYERSEPGVTADRALADMRRVRESMKDMPLTYPTGVPDDTRHAGKHPALGAPYSSARASLGAQWEARGGGGQDWRDVLDRIDRVKRAVTNMPVLPASPFTAEQLRNASPEELNEMFAVDGESTVAGAVVGEGLKPSQLWPLTERDIRLLQTAFDHLDGEFAYVLTRDQRSSAITGAADPRSPEMYVRDDRRLQYLCAAGFMEYRGKSRVERTEDWRFLYAITPLGRELMATCDRNKAGSAFRDFQRDLLARIAAGLGLGFADGGFVSGGVGGLKVGEIAAGLSRPGEIKVKKLAADPVSDIDQVRALVRSAKAVMRTTGDDYPYIVHSASGRVLGRGATEEAAWSCALAAVRADRLVEVRGAVLAVRPKAEATREDNPTRWLVGHYNSLGIYDVLGRGDTELEAWEAAAKA
jgi:hypothetical protein